MNNQSTPVCYVGNPNDAYLSVFRGSLQLLYSQIVRLEGDRNYTHFVMADGRRILTSKSLAFYEAVLPNTFVRVHKHCLLNRLYISTHHKIHVEMYDGFVVQIARRRRGVVMAQ
jgi:DNA-binding LytR/AlgR family response regulator